MNCLKTTNKVKKLNLSKNKLCTDLKYFKSIVRFLSMNKILEELNLAQCNLPEEACRMIGRGLRGNMNLQSLNLRESQVRSGLTEIARSFAQNKKGLCLKSLDVSKCDIIDEHITAEFVEMLSSPFTTLKILNLRENLIRYEGSEKILAALEDNKNIIKMPMDFNPIKREVADAIEKICKRNQGIDAIE